jgi:hypothetical protein
MLEKRSPLKELIPIEASPNKDKGKSREEGELEEEAVKRVQSPSLTASEYVGSFHHGDSASVYNWIDGATGDSWLDLDIKETEWLTDQSYFNANKEESTK